MPLREVRAFSELMGSTDAPELVTHIDQAWNARRHLAPAWATQGNQPWTCAQNEAGGAEIAGVEPVGFLPRPTASRLSGVTMRSGVGSWVLCAGGGWSREGVDSGKCRCLGTPFPFQRRARSDQTDPSAAIGVLLRYTVHGMIPREGGMQMMPPALARALGRHPGPNYAVFRSACRPQCREGQDNTTVKSPIGQNVTQDRLLIWVMTIAHAARALPSVPRVSLDELYAGRG